MTFDDDLRVLFLVGLPQPPPGFKPPTAEQLMAADERMREMLRRGVTCFVIGFGPTLH